RRRARREVGSAAEPDRRLHREYGFRAGGGRRGAGELDAFRFVLPGEASVFQFGAPQQIDIFFSRRIGLSGTGATGVPIDILGGARLSGKVAGYNIGLLNMQTNSATDAH